MPTDYAIHSDFLVHWTGKDLEDPGSAWIDDDGSTIDKNSPLSHAYVDRLYDILKYGLWLTEEEEQSFKIGDHDVGIPTTPKLCFTELRLSESRVHAERYGRLGIGVKRRFLFDRFGRPLTYFWHRGQPCNDPFLRACAIELTDKSLLNFFKPMNSEVKSKKPALNYDLYTESEWRILYFEELLRTRRLIDPRDPANESERAYLRSLPPSQQAKLRYLAPLDGWFQLIIYPSLGVKNLAQKKEAARLRAEMVRIKTNPDDRANQVEDGNWPMEIDLDACRHF